MHSIKLWLDPRPAAGDARCARRLLAFVAPYAPTFLAALADGADREQTGAALRHRVGDAPLVLARVGRASDLCRPGDVLAGSDPAVLAAWEAAGGIAVPCAGAAAAEAALRSLGLLGGGAYAPGLLAEAESRRAAFRRDGYSAYVLSAGSRAALADRFRLREGAAPGARYRLVCEHVTRAFPAGRDTVDDTSPRIEVVGEFACDATGHHVLAVAVDGELVRPDGGYYHVTHALDDHPASVAARAATGSKRPTASDSNLLLASVVSAARGDVRALANLDPARRIVVQAEYALLDREKEPSARKPKQPQSVSEESFVHPSGEPGRRVSRRRGDVVSVTTEDAEGRKHGEDGEPAILTLDTRTGEVVFSAFYCHGEKLPGPLWRDAAPGPR